MSLLELRPRGQLGPGSTRGVSIESPGNPAGFSRGHNDLRWVETTRSCRLQRLFGVANARAAARRHAVLTVGQARGASASMRQFPHRFPDGIYWVTLCPGRSARRGVTSDTRSYGKMRRTEVYAALIIAALANPVWGQNIFVIRGQDDHGRSPGAAYFHAGELATSTKSA